MIISAIKSLERAKRILDDIPAHINTERNIALSNINDLFDDFQVQFTDDEETLPKIVAFRRDVLRQIEGFCDAACEGVKEDVRIVEE